MTQNLWLLFISLAFLTACETGKALNADKDTKAPSQKLSMIDISRGLSDGAVDVYESSGPLLTKPVPPSGKNFAASSVAKNQDIITTDPNVVIFDVSTGRPIQSSAQIQPVEMDLEIPPIGLPDLQPPVEALGELPSPFDNEGNLLPDEKISTKAVKPPSKPRL